MPKFQIATKPGHRASEHLFVILSIMAYHESESEAFIINMFDLRKYFDHENAKDCVYEVYKNKVKGKLYKLLYNMNKSTRIKVQTPVGLSHSEETGAGITHGSVEGAVSSAVNLNNGVIGNDDELYELNSRKLMEQQFLSLPIPQV